MSKFKNRNSGWQIALILGIFGKYIYDLKQLSLYDFYLYFYVAGLICYLYTFTFWGEISKEALSLRYGFFNNKSLEVQWKDIESIEVEKLLVKERDAGHGRFNISYHQEVEYKALIIRMHMPLSLPMIKVINKTQGYSYFTNRIERGKDSKSLMVLTDPDDGFISVIRKTKRFVKSGILCEIKESSETLKLAKRILNIFILLLSAYSFLWSI